MAGEEFVAAAVSMVVRVEGWREELILPPQGQRLSGGPNTPSRQHNSCASENKIFSIEIQNFGETL